MDSQTQRHLHLAGRELVLVGTAHVSEASVQEVSSCIEAEKPDTVAIELDEKRLKSLEDPESWRNMDIVKVLREKNGFLMLSNIILASFQKRMGIDAGVKPGDEMLAAIQKSKELGLDISMVDRPITVTLRRAWAKNSLWGKCNLLALLVSSAFSKDEIEPEQIEKLKNRSEMDDMMEELSKELPVVKEVLIDERDYYLASHIWASRGNKVLAVLGAGHLPGVQAHLEKLAAGNLSEALFDSVTFANIVEDQGLENTKKEITVTAYAIQADDLSTDTPAGVWQIIKNQAPAADDRTGEDESTDIA